MLGFSFKKCVIKYSSTIQKSLSSESFYTLETTVQNLSQEQLEWIGSSAIYCCTFVKCYEELNIKGFNNL